MYFNDRFCNPQYVNQYYYLQQQEYIRQMKQDLEVQKAAKAARDLCRAVKNMDEQHQQHAFWLAFASWQKNTDGAPLRFNLMPRTCLKDEEKL